MVVCSVIPYKPFVDEALTIAKTPVSNVIVVQRPQVAATLVGGRDWNWHDIIDDTTRAIPVSPVPMNALDPLYVCTQHHNVHSLPLALCQSIHN